MSNPTIPSIILKDTFHLQQFFNNEQLNFEPPLYCIVLLYLFPPVQKHVQTHTHTHKKDSKLMFSDHFSYTICIFSFFNHT